MKEKDELFYELYQLAAGLLLSSYHLTDGQYERLSLLLLDVLSDPKRYTSSLVRELRELAVKN